MGWDGDRARASVAARGSASRDASDQESDLIVAAVVDASDAPQSRNREICNLSVFLASSIRLLPREDLLGFDLSAFSLMQLKCSHLVLAKAPLLEEAIFNQNQAAAERRRATRKAQHKKCQIAKRDHNNDGNKRRKAGE
jgi:hypothetical protein